MAFLIILLTTIIIFLIGFMIIELFKFLNNESLIAKLSYSWGLGVGLIGMQLFLYSLLRINWSRIGILLPWIVVLGISLLVRHLGKRRQVLDGSWRRASRILRRLGSGQARKQALLRMRVKVKRLAKIEIFYSALIILLLFFTGFESILRPVQAWDAWDNWVLRPKVFFMHNNLDLDYVRYASDDYPLIIPLMGTFGYIMIGKVDDTHVLFLFYIFYLALGGLFFSVSQSMHKRKTALLMTFLLLSLQNLIRHGGRFEAGQADLALGFYIFAGTMLLVNFLKSKKWKTLLLLSIFLGITGQVKNDGMSFVIGVNCILLFSIIKWKKYDYLFYMLPAFFMIGLWELYKRYNHYPGNILFRFGMHVHTDKVFAIIIAMGKEFFNFQNWSLLWIVFLVSLIVSWRKIYRVKIFLLVFCLQWLSYFGVFLISPREPVSLVEGTIDRLYIHLAPLAVFMIGLLYDSSVLGHLPSKLALENFSLTMKLKLRQLVQRRD